MNKNISVAMATYNGARYIEDQLVSLLNQNLAPDEIIVCDDGSTDDTVAIINKYKQQGNIQLFINDKSLGITSNFKKAVSLCKIENRIAFCDQDDVWLPEKLLIESDIMDTIDGNTPGIVFSDLSVTSENLKITHNSFWEVLNVKPEKETIHSLLFGNFITGCTILMNAVMRRHFVSMPSKFMHDAWVGLIAFSIGSYKFIDTPLVLYRQHGSNVTFSTNTSETLNRKFKKNIRQATNHLSHLEKEIDMAEKFCDFYAGNLTSQQHKIFQKFINLKTVGYFSKKIASVYARSYRFFPFG